MIVSQRAGLRLLLALLLFELGVAAATSEAGIREIVSRTLVNMTVAEKANN